MTVQTAYRLARWVTSHHGWGIELDGRLLGIVPDPLDGLGYQRLAWFLCDLGKLDGAWVPMWPDERADIHLYQGDSILRSVHYDYSFKMWTVGLYTADRHDTVEQAMEAAEASILRGEL